MSNNLRDFSNSFQSNTNNIEQQAKDLISKYKNMDNAELATTLFNEVAKQKANGTFDRKQLLSMLELIKPMLKDEKQFEELKQVIQKL